MLLMIDNYDSFTYNVVQAVARRGVEVHVRRNDAVTPEEAVALEPDGLLISPGPGRPVDAGVCRALVERFAGRIPVLGICLGHQVIVEAFGGQVGRAERVMHGRSSRVYNDGRTIFTGLGNPFEAGRYHSLIARETSLPAVLRVSAYTADGEVMGVRHREHAVEGVQFHPESILTPEGDRLLGNWVRLCAIRREVAS